MMTAAGAPALGPHTFFQILARTAWSTIVSRRRRGGRVVDTNFNGVWGLESENIGHDRNKDGVPVSTALRGAVSLPQSLRF